MLKNYIKIAMRNLWKHKTFALINTTGLAVAFGAVILLAFTAFYELSFDSFHQNKDSIYQVYVEEHGAKGIETASSMPIPFTPALVSEFPDVKYISRFGDIGGSVIRYGSKEFNFDCRLVDAGFFKMFTFPVVKGNSNEPLKGINDMVITEATAKGIFGNADAIGKVVQIKINNEFKAFKITAVTSNTPQNSSITYDMAIRFENAPYYESQKNKWDNSTHLVYIQLPENNVPQHFEQKLKKFVHKYYADGLKQLKNDGGVPDKEGEYLRIKLLPITEMHFSKIGQSNATNKFYPYLLLLISVFILFIATVNFINLSLGRAFTRACEVGVRKVLGASRLQIIIQFCSESIIICTVSLIIGTLLAVLLLPQYKLIFNQQLNFDALKSGLIPLGLLAGFLLVAILSGAYPAWLMSSFQTSQTVKGKISMGKSNSMRNSLMVVQFVLSGLLVICTTIAWQQLNYLRSKPLGYNKNQIISIPIGSNMDTERALQLMRVQLATNPAVLSVTGTDMNMGRGRDNSSSTSIMGFEYKGKTVKTHWRRIDYNYISTMGLQLLNGRDFSKSYGTDTGALLINQKMAQEMGEKNPVGKFIDAGGSKMQIIGVVGNFNFQSLQKEIAPLSMLIQPNWPLGYIFVRVKPGNLADAFSSITATWKQINPRAESEASFLDENVDKQYKKEERLSKIFIIGAMLAIIISCMGLFAIAILVIGQRTKEIGIRKVLGAGILSILSLISVDFLKLIAISVLIASPIAWYAMSGWLQDFAYHINISIWVFVLSGLLTLAVALLTLSFQTVRAALANPVKSLRSE